MVPDQVFALGLDTEVDEASVLQHAYFKVEGIASSVGIRILPEADKKALQKAGNFPSYEFSKDLPLLMIQPKTPFPENKKVTFVWDAGIKSSASGMARKRQLLLPFASRPLFQATFSCERENAKANCSPFSDMQLHFNSEIPADQAKQIKLVAPNGKEYFAQIDKGASTVGDLTFNATVQGEPKF